MVTNVIQGTFSLWPMSARKLAWNPAHAALPSQPQLRMRPLGGVWAGQSCFPPGARAVAGMASGEADAVLGLPPRAPGGPVLRTVEMHAGGEPLRVVPPGALGPLEAPLAGLPLLARRRRLLEAPELDAARRLLMHEPRGHRDMYGAVLVPSELPGAAAGALFVHQEGASSMCGHAVLCLGRFALDFGLCPPPPAPGEVPVTIHCPCGPVTAFVRWDGRRSGSRVRFQSVPAFAAAVGRQAMGLDALPSVYNSRAADKRIRGYLCSGEEGPTVILIQYCIRVVSISVLCGSPNCLI